MFQLRYVFAETAIEISSIQPDSISAENFFAILFLAEISSFTPPGQQLFTTEVFLPKFESDKMWNITENV